jgi:hypothetical protein
VLPGLPGTGRWPEQFGSGGGWDHQEGFVVEFSPEGKSAWVGNFQPGAGHCNAVLPLPDANRFIVIARGHGFIVDITERALLATFGGRIHSFVPAPEAGLLIFESGTELEAWDAKTGVMRWRTARISWDGLRNLRVICGQIEGEAWNPAPDRWTPFSVDLRTGKVNGGSYRISRPTT